MRVGPLSPATRSCDDVDLLGTVLFLTRWLGMFVIVALVVQTHPLVGSDAFWMTRPISWRELLASKICSWERHSSRSRPVRTRPDGWPAGCRSPRLFPSRFKPVLFQLPLAPLRDGASSVTKNLARFALVAGSVLIGLILFLNLLIAVMMRRLDDGPQMVEVIPRTESSPIGAVVMLLLIIAAFFTLTAVQYRTRLIRASVLSGVAGIGVAFAAVFLWPSWGRLVPVPDWASRDSSVQLVAESARGEFTPRDNGSPWSRADGWQLGHVRLRVDAIEAGWLSTVKLKDANVGFEDGATVRTAGNGYATEAVLTFMDGSITEGPRNVVARQVLGVNRLLEGPAFPQSETR